MSVLSWTDKIADACGESCLNGGMCTLMLSCLMARICARILEEMCIMTLKFEDWLCSGFHG